MRGRIARAVASAIREARGRRRALAANIEAGGRAGARAAVEAQAAGDREIGARKAQGRRARRARALEEAPSQCGWRTSSQRTCSSTRCAAATRRGRACGSICSTCRRKLRPAQGALGPGREDAFQLVGLRDLELVVAAFLRWFVRAASAGTWRRGESDCPADGRTSLRKTARAQRLHERSLPPLQRLWPPRHATRLRRRSAQSRHGWVACRILAQRREPLHELLAHRHAEGRGDTNVLQTPASSRGRGGASRRRPCRSCAAKAATTPIGGARVLHLDHRALARLVREAGGLGDDAVEARASKCSSHCWARSRSRVTGVT